MKIYNSFNLSFTDGYESLNRSVYNLKVLQSTYNFMDQGHYRPVTCIPRQKVAILIPYRNREKGLLTLLNNVLPRIHRQQIEFGIYVVEQVNLTLTILENTWLRSEGYMILNITVVYICINKIV